MMPPVKNIMIQVCNDASNVIRNKINRINKITIHLESSRDEYCDIFFIVNTELSHLGTNISTVRQ